MSDKEKTALVPRLRFNEFRTNGAVIFKNGNLIFEPINNKDHNSDLPVLAITQEYGAIPRDQIDYNVSVTDKSLKSYKVVEVGDFIISLRSFQGGIEYSLFHGICSPAYIVLRKKIDIVEQYYKYYFKTSNFIQDLNKDLEGIRDGKMVSYSQFSSILLPKPDNKEQQKIADFLTSLDDLIAAEDKKLSTLRDHKKGLMQKLFPAEGKTLPEWRFPEFRDCGEWENNTLGSACISITSGKTKTKNSQGLYPLYGSTGIIGYTNSLDYDGEYLLIARVGANAGQIRVISGKCGVSDNTLVVKFDSKNICAIFLSNFLINYNLNKIIFGSGQPLITGKQLNSLVISLPATPEQKKIADCLYSIDALINAQTEKIEALKAHKKGLMQGLFPSIEEVGE